MNAKVQIQFPEQSIPFYSADDVLTFYSLAFDATVQIRTLVNQISKSIIKIKSAAHENKADNPIFTELENLIKVSLYLTNSQADAYSLEQQRYQKEFDAQCDAGDLLDAHSLVFTNMVWLSTMLGQIKQETAQLKDELTKKGFHLACFYSLEGLIEICEYLLEEQVNTSDSERENYEIQWEATKNG
ncbi:hypothetical protein F906_01705 [Acinetobacter pseudolwoffii]|uniref:Uncharacterized protein n=1 Tax=Acinetobacter pseudolwoffii TaxID=2053287 RepID=N9M7L0_9GAMM|nr:hypothetical protein [Acinetobacter pseudolwoffii]ENW86646.1 hypothetical protein F906_01705 [Acinetobacter pseudolwoffii]